jgi:hypothetical protein
MLILKKNSRLFSVLDRSQPLGLNFCAKRKKWVMSPNIAQKSSKIPLQLQPCGLFSNWVILYFEIALGLKLKSRGEKQPKIAAGLIWAIQTGL